MKKIIISLVTLFIAIDCFAQDSDSFLKSWTDLKSQFLIKSDAAKDIAILAMDSKKVNIASLEKIKGLSFALSQVIRNAKDPDKPGIQRISQFADSLDYYSTALSKAITKDPQFPSPKAYAEFEKILLDADTKLEVYKYDFNRACRKLNKPELAFPK